MLRTLAALAPIATLLPPQARLVTTQAHTVSTPYHARRAPSGGKARVQGFCCDCSSAQVWQETVGKPQERTRAGLNCDYFENPYIPIFGSPPGSAHCLVYQSEWCVPGAKLLVRRSLFAARKRQECDLISR